MSNKIAFFSVFYAIWYITTAFFTSNTVLYHTVNNIFVIFLAILLSFQIAGSVPQMQFLKVILLSFWAGQVLLYLIQLFRFTELYTWLDSFNNPYLLVPVYLLSLFTGIIYFQRYGANNGWSKFGLFGWVARFWDQLNKGHRKKQDRERKTPGRNTSNKRGRRGDQKRASKKV